MSLLQGGWWSFDVATRLSFRGANFLDAGVDGVASSLDQAEFYQLVVLRRFASGP